MKSSPGFTLIEFLLAIGILFFLFGLTAAISTEAVKYGEFDRVREAIRSELVAAQSDSAAGTLDANWGVAFSAHSVTRYQGSSYATRNATYDSQTIFGNNVTIGGTTDVPFTRPSGLPLSPAIITMTDGSHHATTTVHSSGAVSVQ